MIPAGVKFQVSLPTVVSLLAVFVDKGDCAKVEPALEAAMKREIDTMAAAIPASDLAIQWDAASEIIGHDGGADLYYSDVLSNSVDRLVRLVSFIPASVEVGIHLCYGDPGHKHVIEPKDAGTCVAFANAICQLANATVDGSTFRSPADGTGSNTTEPLADLKTPVETEIYLGLVHYTDGLEGTKHRLGLAQQQRADFGLATECGYLGAGIRRRSRACSKFTARLPGRPDRFPAVRARLASPGTT